MWNFIKRVLVGVGISFLILFGAAWLIVYGLYFAHPNSHKPVIETLAYMKELRMAMMLYQSEYHKYPESLNQLVPKYAPSLPENKIFNSADKPFVYTQTNKGEGYILCGTILNPPPDIVVDTNHQYCFSQDTGI